MPVSMIDIILTALFAVGLSQLVWLSVMLVRKGVAPSTLAVSLPPFISIWVVLWPLYETPLSIWAGILLLSLPIVLAYSSRRLFCQHLRVAWSGPLSETAVSPLKSAKQVSAPKPLPQMWPFISLLAALAVAAAFFQRMPEFGLGIALAALLAFPAATLLDRLEHLKLGFPLHPGQTLIGHIGLIVFAAATCTWSLHLYHGISWQQLLIATLIAGMAASVVRAFSPTILMLPLATLAMGTTLWLL